MKRRFLNQCNLFFGWLHQILDSLFLCEVSKFCILYIKQIPKATDDKKFFTLFIKIKNNGFFVV